MGPANDMAMKLDCEIQRGLDEESSKARGGMASNGHEKGSIRAYTAICISLTHTRIVS